MQTHCHCGQVTLSVPSLPAKLNRCSCSICRRYGALWGYYDRASVTVKGATDTYIWGDKVIAFHRCQSCGVLTHWSLIAEDGDKIGVNMQNADQSALVGLAQIDSYASRG